MLHRVDMERPRNSVCIRRTEHFQSLCLGCCGKCKEGQICQTAVSGHFLGDLILAIRLFMLLFGFFVGNLLKLFFFGQPFCIAQNCFHLFAGFAGL